MGKGRLFYVNDDETPASKYQSVNRGFSLAQNLNPGIHQSDVAILLASKQQNYLRTIRQE